MAIKTYKPTTAARRQMTTTDFSELSKVAPERSLLAPLKKNSGRNSYGRITVRHRGGGNRRKYRIIDFKRNKVDMPATVLTLEYDPNRSAHIALVQYEDGEKRYILAPNGLKVGDVIESGEHADIKTGNALPLANIPVGTFIHNVELYPGKGAQLALSLIHISSSRFTLEDPQRQQLAVDLQFEQGEWMRRQITQQTRDGRTLERESRVTSRCV